jgi:hypothetical protein
MTPSQGVKWYPRMWRRRYGEEFSALLDDLRAEGRFGLLAWSEVPWSVLKCQVRLPASRRQIATLGVTSAVLGTTLGLALALDTSWTPPGPSGFGYPALLGSIQDSDASTNMAGEGINGVVVHLVVDADTVTGGEMLVGHIQVINNTRHSVGGGAVCRADVVAPVIYGGAFPERPVFPAHRCSTSFAFPVGVTTLPFSLSASFDSPSGSQPLPTGYYHVGVLTRGPKIPLPSPLTVIVMP